MFYEIQSDLENTLNVFCHDTTSIDPHFHSSIEFVYVLDGNMDFFFNGTHTVLGADDMYAVPSWQPHGNSSVGNNRICSVVFSVNFMKFFRKDHPNEFFPSVLSDRAENRKILGTILDYMACEQKHRGNVPFMKKTAFVNTLLYELAEIYPPVPVTEDKGSSLIIDILAYIEQNYTQPITTESLAKHFHYSTSYISSIFNKFVRCNVPSYVNKLRINKMQKTDRDKNDRKIIDLALNSGFNSPAAYYRTLDKIKKDNDGTNSDGSPARSK